MPILAWLVVGVIAGFVASKVISKTGEGLLLEIVSGVVGALAGGFIFNMLDRSAPNGSTFTASSSPLSAPSSS